MSHGRSSLEAGSLWARATRTSERARRDGAQIPIATEVAVVGDRGPRFLIRTVAGLSRKPTGLAGPAPAQARQANPFLPYEEDLFVTDVSDTHVCLLNKYNVIEHHLLIVTRRFEDQRSLLTAADFCAMWACLAEFDGLAFYNGGRIGGASQRHKHLQMVPLPLAPGEPELPIEPLLQATSNTGRVGRSPLLPFRHSIARVESQWLAAPGAAGPATVETYRALLRAVGMPDNPSVPGGLQSAPYNLLATRRWMMLVPRSRESFASISVNALGFAGSLLARDERERKMLREAGLIAVLTAVGVGPGDPPSGGSPPRLRFR